MEGKSQRWREGGREEGKGDLKFIFEIPGGKTINMAD